MGNPCMGRLRRMLSHCKGSLGSQHCSPAEVSEVLTNSAQVWWTEIPACSGSSAFTLCLLVSQNQKLCCLCVSSLSVKNTSPFFQWHIGLLKKNPKQSQHKFRFWFSWFFFFFPPYTVAMLMLNDLLDLGFLVAFLPRAWGCNALVS